MTRTARTGNARTGTPRTWVGAAALLGALAAGPAQAQTPVEVVTDSVAGALVSFDGMRFVVRTADDRDMLFVLPTDSAQEARAAAQDSVAEEAGRVAHTSFMTRADLAMALQQVQASEESDAVRVHFITEGMPARRIAVWIDVGEP